MNTDQPTSTGPLGCTKLPSNVIQSVINDVLKADLVFSRDIYNIVGFGHKKSVNYV